MCFSAPVSFAAGGVLLAAGSWTMWRARSAPGWLPLAAIPALFGLQQIAEGAVWIGVSSEDAALTTVAAKAYLFFAQSLWLAWLPLSAALIEPDASRRRGLWGLAAFGAVFGSSLYGPVLTDFGDAGLLGVDCAAGSLTYRTGTLWPVGLGNLIYVLLGPLAAFVSSRDQMKTFLFLLFVTAVGTWLVQQATWVSVWCFVAAALSLYVAHWLRGEPLVAQS